MTAKDQPVDELKRYRAFFNDITGCNEDYAAERLMAFCQAECNKARIDELIDELLFNKHGYEYNEPMVLDRHERAQIASDMKQLLKGEK